MSNMPKLTRADKKAIRLASEEDLELAFNASKRHLRHSRWIGKTNSYAKDCVKTLRRQSRPKYPDLSKYIAVSTVLHCLDGWSYLGKAVACHSGGDPNSARHMAYYAELRAAMSLMSGEGIGIFNRHHYVVQSWPKLYKIKNIPTHEVTWQILDNWAKLQGSFGFLGKIITPGNLPIDQWLSEFGAGITFRLIGKQWFDDWGFDLRSFFLDRDARNEASYRPTRLHTISTLTAVDTSEFLRSLWQMFEPVANSRFGIVDRHLLRLSLNKTYKAVSGQEPAANQLDFKRRVELMVENISPTEGSNDYWIKFLTKEIDPLTPQPITEAANLTTRTDAKHHIQVIGRASLLMRLATGACLRLMQNANLTRDDLEFWWAKLGADVGLWDTLNPPIPFTDLWGDVEIALSQLNSWSSQPTLNNSYFDLHRNNPLAILVLGQCERIGLWGLGL